jgi:hypothetical protein
MDDEEANAAVSTKAQRKLILVKKLMRRLGHSERPASSPLSRRGSRVRKWTTNITLRGPEVAM